MEEIIEKDFFPDLEKLNVQQAYYEAVQNNDYDAIRDLMIRYNSLNAKRPSHQMTPSKFDLETNKHFNSFNQNF